MIIDIFLIIYTFVLALITLWAAYSSYLVFKCGVPPVPTSKARVKIMIKAANIGENQNIYDLGCGFGDILLAAAKQNPQNQYQGFDINRPVVWIAKIRNKIRRTNIHFQDLDFFEQDLAQADVIFSYLWPSIMERIETEIWPTLKPGTKLVSHAFPLPKTPHTEAIKLKRGQVFVYVKD